MHVSDGRSFVRDSHDKYDVVQMTLVDTWASTAAGAFALSENNLYTVEAFREYFDHLRPDGMIAVTRSEFSKPREALAWFRRPSKPCANGGRGPLAEFHRGRRSFVDSDGRTVWSWPENTVHDEGGERCSIIFRVRMARNPTSICASCICL